MDIHKIQAAKIFNTSVDSVNQEMRVVGKLVNYGNLYNMRRYPKDSLENMLNKLKDTVVIKKEGKPVRFNFLTSSDYITKAIKFIECLGESNVKEIKIEPWGGRKYSELTLQCLYKMKMIEELSK